MHPVCKGLKPKQMDIKPKKKPTFTPTTSQFLYVTLGLCQKRAFGTV